MEMINKSHVCRDMVDLKNRSQWMECVEIIKEYDPKPRNADGSIRWFLYRWDDGKKGVRRLARCRKCGAYFLIQAYQLHKFSRYKDIKYEDWYPIENEREADKVNMAYTGLQWELIQRPVLRCKNDIMELWYSGDYVAGTESIRG